MFRLNESEFSQKYCPFTHKSNTFINLWQAMTCESVRIKRVQIVRICNKIFDVTRLRILF